MATSQVIVKESFLNIPKSTQYKWWQYTNLKVKYSQNFNEKQVLEKFKNDSIMSLNKPIRNGINALYQSLILGDITHEEVVFKYFDSSILCRRRILDMLKQTLKRHKNKQVIILATQTGLRENKYKLQNKIKYPEVDFEILEENNSILKNKIIDNLGLYHSVILVDSEMEFEIDYDLMYNFYVTNDKVLLNGSKNEINDDVQIQVLKTILNFVPYTKIFLFTDDIGMIEKTKNEKNIHIFSTRYFLRNISYIKIK
jgi:hypothetical protein